MDDLSSSISTPDSAQRRCCLEADWARMVFVSEARRFDLVLLDGCSRLTHVPCGTAQERGPADPDDLLPSDTAQAVICTSEVTTCRYSSIHS